MSGLTTRLINAVQRITLLTLPFQFAGSLCPSKTLMTQTEALYKPYRKHPALFAEEFQESWLHPDVLEIVEKLKSADVYADPAKITPLLKVEMPGVYSFQCFTPHFLQMFNEEIENFYEVSDKHQIPVHRPNSMNNYGVIVNEIGMRPLITSFQKNYLWPMARRLFPREGSQFDDHHSFIVRYRADEDLGLDMHTDDSDVTFNVCLGEVFTGATLSFCGMFGAPDHRKWSHTYKHEVGRAVIHLGSRRHGADDIASGSRSNLIVWNHNWAWRSSPEYKRGRDFLYEKEEGPPDEVCLSYTHDKDFSAYKELPERAKGIHSHPWCPPSGREYDGFDTVHEKLHGAKKNEL